MNIRAIVIAGALALTPLSSMALGWDWFNGQTGQTIISTGGVSGYYIDGYNIPREIFLVGGAPVVVVEEKEEVKHH
ncbi:hypothetical protein [Legionella impletisoli]|uniref:Uncharacterized protein n=1 Tax=Legionella impletisoli TaxID=343510 RepID=A0A917K0U3_9GAMM|nr:hypothetical protein [Legionella impletisoli]GGI92548.1 hypothetical protein GCM10007966_21480 [Legionella impletisoli]